MEEENIAQNEEQEFDADMAYEKMRDDAGDNLQEVLTDTYNMFVKAKSGYYKGANCRFVEHSLDILNELAGTEAVVDGELVSIKRKEEED